MLTINRFFILCGFYSCFFYSLINDVRAEEPQHIQNGYLASSDAFKFYVSFRGQYRRHFCGGAILDDYHILTAAHCVVHLNIDRFEEDLILVARRNAKSTEEAEIIGKVERIYAPTKFKGGFNDIAVLKLEKSLELSKNSKLSKINLPTHYQSYEGEIAESPGSGFDKVEPCINATGHDDYCHSQVDYRLKYLLMDIMNNRECQSLHSWVTINTANVCGLPMPTAPPVDQIVCYGDSGSPLVFKDTVIGVITLGPGSCVDLITPTVYTRVSEYLPFIRDAMTDTSNPTTRVAAYNKHYSTYIQIR